MCKAIENSAYQVKCSIPKSYYQLNKRDKLMNTNFDWAIVLATFLGPIFAIFASEIIRSRTDKQQRKNYIFRSLMATRRLAISHEHVNALNLIEVEFHKDKDVINAWKKYLTHLNQVRDQMPNIQWNEIKDQILAELLEHMAIKLNYKFTSMELFRGGYAPIGWQETEELQRKALQGLEMLVNGKTSIPVNINSQQ